MARPTGKLRHGLSFHCWGKGPLWFPGPRTPQIFGFDHISKTRLHSRWIGHCSVSGTALARLPRGGSPRYHQRPAGEDGYWHACCLPPCFFESGKFYSGGTITCLKQFFFPPIKYIISLCFQLAALGQRPQCPYHGTNNKPSFSFVCSSKYWEVTDRINSLYWENFKSICKYWFGS